MATEVFAEWFRRQLKRRGWNQARFHRESGIPRSTVSTWATGLRTPEPEYCEKIAEVLDVDRDEVLALAGHREPDEPIEADDPRRELLTLVKMLRLTPDRQVGLRHLMRGWIDEDKRQQQTKGEGA